MSHSIKNSLWLSSSQTKKKMRSTKQLLGLMFLSSIFAISSCDSPAGNESADTDNQETVEEGDDGFQWETETFADLRVLRYQVPGFEQLSLEQKKLVYYLTQAGLSGRDIIYDQNHRHNLKIRRALEHIVTNYSGSKEDADWKAFEVYAKRVWFSNGIYHHYSNQKIQPEFSQEYFDGLLASTGHDLADEVLTLMFDASIEPKKVSKDPNSDLCTSSAVNFFDPDITEADVDAYYANVIDKTDPQPVSYGLNSKLVRAEDGSIMEKTYKIGGMYGEALERVSFWIKKAAEVAENSLQKDALLKLVEYYETGDLRTWDEYNVLWTQATEGDIDYINGFIEVYNDPRGMRGSFESIVEIKDFDASARMQVVSENVQWFEDYSPILDAHKKANVVGVSYKTVNVASESGDASPSTPIGVNLPNANWIRAQHGSKSVSLGNIEGAYEKASGAGFLEEFAFSTAEIERAKAHGELAGKLHTALHEVVGHASGKLNPGVGTPKETLKNYSSTLEEARADLVALYYLLDNKLIELGLMESLEVGKAEYDNYIRNGMMVQLRRLKPGEVLEEDHMRNRQLVAGWAYDKGMKEGVIEKKNVDGKTYFVVQDYDKLRVLFGELLREIQRIKSEGDYEAGKNLVETYGVQVDADIHNEVLQRSEKLNIAPYSGFINPVLETVEENGEITDVVVTYPDNFTEQMLFYANTYSFLPDEN